MMQSNGILHKAKDKKYKKRMAVTMIAAIFLVCLHAVIFGFSAQDSEASGSLSFSLSKKCVDLLETVSPNRWDADFKERLALYFENPIRKLAHFTEYACMGFLWQLILLQWKEPNKYAALFVTIWVALVAASDEIHQLFVPGRFGCVADVFLDTLGGVFGLLILLSGNRLMKAARRDCK